MCVALIIYLYMLLLPLLLVLSTCNFYYFFFQVRHGFPYKTTCMAFDQIQKLLAIGTRVGSVRIFGRPGVDVEFHHEGGDPVTQLLFVVNTGIKT